MLALNAISSTELLFGHNKRAKLAIVMFKIKFLQHTSVTKLTKAFFLTTIDTLKMRKFKRTGKITSAQITLSNLHFASLLHHLIVGLCLLKSTIAVINPTALHRKKSMNGRLSLKNLFSSQTAGSISQTIMGTRFSQNLLTDTKPIMYSKNTSSIKCRSIKLTLKKVCQDLALHQTTKERGLTQNQSIEREMDTRTMICFLQQKFSSTRTCSTIKGQYTQFLTCLEILVDFLMLCKYCSSSQSCSFFQYLAILCIITCSKLSSSETQPLTQAVRCLSSQMTISLNSCITDRSSLCLRQHSAA